VGCDTAAPPKRWHMTSHPRESGVSNIDAQMVHQYVDVIGGKCFYLRRTEWTGQQILVVSIWCISFHLKQAKQMGVLD